MDLPNVNVFLYEEADNRLLYNVVTCILAF